MRLSVEEPGAIAAFVAEALPHVAAAGGFNDYCAIGIRDRAGELAGGLVLTHVNAFDAHISARLARPNALTPCIVESLFGFGFKTLGLARMTMLIAPDNKAALRIAEGLGFQPEGRLAKGYDGDRDALIYGATADTCNWIGER